MRRGLWHPLPGSVVQINVVEFANELISVPNISMSVYDILVLKT